MTDLFGNAVEPPSESKPIYVRVCVVCEGAFDGNKHKTCPSGCRQPTASLGDRRHLAAIRAAESCQETISEDAAAAEAWAYREERGGFGASLSIRISMAMQGRRW